MMLHVLDNPVWNALISGNKGLSSGNEKAKYFLKDVAPFAAVNAVTKREFETLYDIADPGDSFAFFSSQEIEIPQPWKVSHCTRALQMVHNKAVQNKTVVDDIVALSTKDVPAMLALTKLTNPGPFLKRTIEFGNYEGIFKNGELVAMTGQRMHPFEYIEVSAVCTHPEHTGHGYATNLIVRQIDHIRAQSSIPFLHVKKQNTNAIKLYNALGFSVRKEMFIYGIKKT